MHGSIKGYGGQAERIIIPISIPAAPDIFRICISGLWNSLYGTVIGTTTGAGRVWHKSFDALFIIS